MVGYNHHPDCTCPWYLSLNGGRGGKVLYRSAGKGATFGSYTSFTVPNAVCPVCGASVFFYQSPTGGRVFFDELGPPWQKHPCTDSSALELGKPLSLPARSYPLWKKEGWEPIRIKSSRLDGNWHLIPVENLVTRLHFDALAEGPLRLQGETCAFMKPWDSSGWSKISLVELDRDARESIIPVFEKKRYFRTSRIAATAHRRRNPRT